MKKLSLITFIVISIIVLIKEGSSLRRTKVESSNTTAISDTLNTKLVVHNSDRDCLGKEINCLNK